MHREPKLSLFKMLQRGTFTSLGIRHKLAPLRQLTAESRNSSALLLSSGILLDSPTTSGKTFRCSSNGFDLLGAQIHREPTNLRWKSSHFQTAFHFSSQINDPRCVNTVFHTVYLIKIYKSSVSPKLLSMQSNLYTRHKTHKASKFTRHYEWQQPIQERCCNQRWAKPGH